MKLKEFTDTFGWKRMRGLQILVPTPCPGFYDVIVRLVRPALWTWLSSCVDSPLDQEPASQSNGLSAFPPSDAVISRNYLLKPIPRIYGVMPNTMMMCNYSD